MLQVTTCDNNDIRPAEEITAASQCKDNCDEAADCVAFVFTGSHCSIKNSCKSRRFSENTLTYFKGLYLLQPCCEVVLFFTMSLCVGFLLQFWSNAPKITTNHTLSQPLCEVCFFKNCFTK